MPFVIVYLGNDSTMKFALRASSDLAADYADERGSDQPQIYTDNTDKITTQLFLLICFIRVHLWLFFRIRVYPHNPRLFLVPS